MFEVTYSPSLADCRADMHILAIQANPARNQMVRHAFIEAGYTDHLIETVSTAHEGLHCLTAGDHYDLVLVDLDLPDGSGKDLVRYAGSLYPDLPFVALIEEKDEAWDVYDHLVVPAIGGAGCVSMSLPRTPFVTQVESIWDSFIERDEGSQTAVDLYATEAAERTLEHGALTRWLATQFCHHIGHLMEVGGMEKQSGATLSLREQQALGCLQDVLALSHALSNAQVRREPLSLTQLIEGVGRRLDGRYHFIHRPDVHPIQINTNPHLMAFVLAKICKSCQATQYQWNLATENGHIALRITPLDTLLVPEPHNRWHMLQPLLRLLHAKMTYTSHEILISLPH